VRAGGHVDWAGVLSDPAFADALAGRNARDLCNRWNKINR